MARDLCPRPRADGFARSPPRLNEGTLGNVGNHQQRWKQIRRLGGSRFTETQKNLKNKTMAPRASCQDESGRMAVTLGIDLRPSTAAGAFHLLCGLEGLIRAAPFSLCSPLLQWWRRRAESGSRAEPYICTALHLLIFSERPGPVFSVTTS